MQTWRQIEQKDLLAQWKVCIFKDSRNIKLSSELKDLIFKQDKRKDVFNCLQLF